MASRGRGVAVLILEALCGHVAEVLHLVVDVGSC